MMMGNPVITLPGNQKVIGRVNHPVPPSLQTGWGLHFHYFTSAVSVISCLNYREVNGSPHGATAQEVKAKMKKSHCGRRKVEARARLEETRRDIYSRLSSAHSAAFEMLFLFPPTLLLASSLCWFSFSLPRCQLSRAHVPLWPANWEDRKGSLGHLWAQLMDTQVSGDEDERKRLVIPRFTAGFQLPVNRVRNLMLVYITAKIIMFICFLAES